MHLPRLRPALPPAGALLAAGALAAAAAGPAAAAPGDPLTLSGPAAGAQLAAGAAPDLQARSVPGDSRREPRGGPAASRAKAGWGCASGATPRPPTRAGASPPTSPRRREPPWRAIRRCTTS